MSNALMETDHICSLHQPTDGLQPIERFLKNGQLDDHG